MNRLAFAFAVLAAAAPLQAQVTAQSDTVKALAKKAGLSVKYDKIEGRTVISGDNWEVKSGAASLGPTIRMRLVCVATGGSISLGDTDCAMIFSARSAIDWSLGPTRQVTILADDTLRMRLPVTQPASLSAAGGIRREDVAAELTVNQLLLLGFTPAREVIGRIGSHEFKLGDWSMKELRALALIVTAHEE
jgi:hypothetical protein